MSENRNTGGAVNIELEKRNEETISVAGPGSIISKKETGDMETHAEHLHHAPGKKIRHYFFEFLMLFLAVFCGFIAENWREQIAGASTRKGIYPLYSGRSKIRYTPV